MAILFIIGCVVAMLLLAVSGIEMNVEQMNKNKGVMVVIKMQRKRWELANKRKRGVK